MFTTTQQPQLFFVRLSFPEASFLLVIGAAGSDRDRQFTSSLFTALVSSSDLEPKDIRGITLAGTQYIRATVAVVSKAAADRLLALSATGKVCVVMDQSQHCTQGSTILTTASSDTVQDHSLDDQPSPQSASSSSTPLSAGAAVGIGALVALFVALAVFVAVRKHRAAKRSPTSLSSSASSADKSSTSYLEYLRSMHPKAELAAADDDDEGDNEVIPSKRASYDHGHDEESYDRGHEDVYSQAKSETAVGYSSANKEDDEEDNAYDPKTLEQDYDEGEAKEDAGYSKADNEDCGSHGYARADDCEESGPAKEMDEPIA